MKRSVKMGDSEEEDIGNLKTRERTMFTELNMMGDTKTMSYGIIVAKSLLWYTIAKEITKTGRRMEFFSFVNRKRDKTSTTKNWKKWVVRGLTIEELEWWFVMCGWWKNTINGVNSSECYLILKALRNKGWNEKGADNIKNVTMFSFCKTIFFRGTRLVKV